MRISPAKKYSEPAIPTHSILDEHPELLKLVPKRWQHNPIVLSALTGLFLLTAGYRQANADDKAKSRIAPIFQHGEGQGSFGCKAISPPVFLSEAEAREVIIEEAKLAGIVFKPDCLTMKDAIPSQLNNRMSLFEKIKDNTPVKMVDLTLDGTEQKRDISFEFMSDQDYRKLGYEELSASTVEVVNLQKAATRLKGDLTKRDPEGTIGVFYDPMASTTEVEAHYKFKPTYSKETWKKDQLKLNELKVELSKEQLREQVKDFIKWLKAEGVI